MLVLRCTMKAFKKIGSVPHYVEVSMDRPTFGEWCVNTVDFINAGNLLLACMHVESLYVLFVPVQPPVTVEQLVTGLQSRLLVRLIELETPPDATRRVLAMYRGEAVLARTNNRRVVGHMNSALRDLEYLLDIPELQLRDGDNLLIPRIEYNLNSTPRGVTNKEAIWPLPAFWQCVRHLCPELPARTSIMPMPVFDKEALRQSGRLLHENLPERLADKIFATLQNGEMLYTVDELQVLGEALDERPRFRDGLPEHQGEHLCHQVQVNLERLLGRRPPP